MKRAIVPGSVMAFKFDEAYGLRRTKVSYRGKIHLQITKLTMSSESRTCLFGMNKFTILSTNLVSNSKTAMPSLSKGSL